MDGLIGRLQNIPCSTIQGIENLTILMYGSKI